MTLGAEAWFLICERLRAGHSSLPLGYDSPLPAAPAGFDLDVNMADTPIFFTPSAGMKRSRDDDDLDLDVFEYEARFEKKARPDSGHGSISDSWIQAQESVLNTPKSLSTTNLGRYQKPHYDSDDQSSMVSEAGSFQDVAMSSADEDMEDDDTVTPSQTYHRRIPSGLWQPWPTRAHANRVPTPILPQQPASRPGVRPMQLRTGHVRHRHPQENLSSELLEVPSPIDEDEVPTPPSAAEAAGSQLSMLTVNDMDMEPSNEPLLPTISIDPSQTLPFGEHAEQSLEMDSAIVDGFETMNSTGGPDGGLMVRKQRARSGALSSGHGSPSPVRAEPVRPEQVSPGGHRRVLSMGFRADCEKCQMRVPGHMNHFIN